MRSLWVFLLCFFAVNCIAQEVQIPFSIDPEIIEISAPMNSSLHLFDTPNFEQALLFQAADSSYIIEIQIHAAETTTRERRSLGFDELTRIRAELRNYCNQPRLRVNFCDHPKIEFIDAEMNKTQPILPSTLNFRIAYLFQLPDSNYLLEVHRQSSQGNVIRYYTLTPEQMTQYRESYSNSPFHSLLQHEQPAQINMYASGAISIFGYPWMVNRALKLHGANTSFGPIFSISYMAFDYYLAKAYPPDMSTALLASYGYPLGGLAGYNLEAAFQHDGKGHEGSVILGSLAGHYLGWFAGQSSHFEESDIILISNLSIYGTALGYATGAVQYNDESRPLQKSHFSTTALIGEGVGAAAGYYCSSSGRLTTGDIEVLLTDAYVAPGVFSLLYSSSNPKAIKSYTPVILGGSVFGFLTGSQLALKYDLNRTQASYYTFMTVFAGPIVGFGLGSIGSTESQAYRTLIPFTTVVASLVARHNLSHDHNWVNGIVPSWLSQIHVNPSGLFASNFGQDHNEGNLMSVSYDF